MQLDIYAKELDDAIWTCLLEKFFYETKCFALIFGNNCELSVNNSAYSKGYTHYLKFNKENENYDLKFQNNNLIWRHQRSRTKLNDCIGFVSLCMSYFEYNRDDALKLLKDKFLSFCSYKDIGKGYESRYSVGSSLGENFIPSLITHKNRNFFRVESYNYFSFKGDNLGLIIKYRDDQDYFELPFFVEKFNLTEIFDFQFVHFPNTFFKKYNCNYSVFDCLNKVIFVCEDFILSEKLNFIIHESKNSNFKDKYHAISLKYVVDEYAGKNINDFKNNELVYIPSASKQSFLDYLTFMNGESSSCGMKIYKSTVFVDDGSTIDLNFDAADLFESYLIQHVDKVDRIDPHYVCKIYDEAINKDDFEKWCKTIGLLSGENADIDTGLVDLQAFMKSLALDKKNSKNNYNWDNFFTPQNINLVVGNSHSGKTFFLLTVTYFLSLKLGSFGFDAKNRYRVLYIDGESTDKYFGDMMESLIMETSFVGSQQQTFFHPHLFKKSKDKFIWDFSNQEFIKKITDLISNGINLVVIDNLNSLAKRFVTSSLKWDSFIQWIDSIQKQFSTAFILAHHSNKKSETLGLESVEGKSHNVIQIFSGDSILDEFDFQSQKDVESIKRHIVKENVVIGINFKKCQSFLDLQNTKHVFYRQKNLVDCDVRWEKIYPDKQYLISEVDKIINDENLDLNVRLLNYAKKNRKFKAADAQKFFSVSRSKITLCINSLIGQSIKKYGKGRSTKYMYIFDD